MELSKMFDENEKPLDRLCEDGGFCSIFRTVACVGDSLSSGEFETVDEEGQTHYTDKYEYSWGQFMARRAGITVYNFSRGGMTAKEYYTSFAEDNDMWNPDKKAQAYIYALGPNDLFGLCQIPGSIDDVHDDDPSQNADTFAGWLGKVVERYRRISPDAKLFFMTMPVSHYDNEHGSLVEQQRRVMREFAAHYPNSYVIDLGKYAPVYDDAFEAKFFMRGHMNPMGYALTGKMVASYIDYIVRHNMKDFELVGMI